MDEKSLFTKFWTNEAKTSKATGGRRPWCPRVSVSAEL